jgi:threonine/homoserine/homoserine lactone efflux protein
MLGLITQGVGFGVAAATSPGPLLSFLINTTLSLGWQHGVRVIFAPLITDLPIILVMTFLLGELPDDALRLLKVVGGLYVLWLAWSAWRTQQPLITQMDAPLTSGTQTLIKAVGMNLISPGPYIFWGVVTGPILRDALDQSTAHAVAFLLAFYGVFLGLMIVWVVVFERLRRVDQRLTQWALTISIVVLALLGLQLVAQGVFNI